MTEPPVITGIGLISVLGDTAGQTWDALLAGGCIADHARIRGVEGPDRVASLAVRVAQQAIRQAQWTPRALADDGTALLVGTSKGPIESWLTAGPEISGLARIDEELARQLALGNGPRLTLSAACASGLHALIRGVMALQSGEARRALVVAVEASVHPLFISSFRRLGVLAPAGYGCRPFDSERKGFVMSDAAAALCLEMPRNAAGRSLLAVDRYALGGEGTHLVAGDPDAKTLRRLLAAVAGDGGVDLIHAHGTGTLVNDPAELAAIESVAGRSKPVLYSHKGALGHSLGAAGMVSVALNCLCHQHGRVPPNIRSIRPLPMGNLRFSSDSIRWEISRSIVLASGFGGPCAAVSLADPIAK